MIPALGKISSLIIVAGISGAGKSTALNTLEDQGYYVIDNLPVSLLPQTIELAQQTPQKFAKTALLLDIDSSEKVAALLDLLRPYSAAPNKPLLLFLDCRGDVVVKRYGETRRPHPGFDPARDKTIADAIQRERSRLQSFKELAHFVADTSDLTVHDLRREIKQFVEKIGLQAERSLRVNFVSFGFKYGLPLDCDLVADVRFLPNPHFVEGLREKTGRDAAVGDFVLKAEAAREFLQKYGELLRFLLPRYVYEGKSYVNIGIGCTGGKHRSVVMAEALVKEIPDKNYFVSIKHRDVEMQ